jgi:hypothetical protein
MVTFDTKVYEKDWKFLLRDGFLKKNIERCNYNFASKNLFINNVQNLKEVLHYANKLKNSKIIDNIYVVEEFEKEVLDFFNLTKESFKGGFYYSIAELTSIYLCSTKYLLHFSGDSFLQKFSKVPWIDESIVIMKENPDILVANPCWNFNFEEARMESFGELKNFYVGYGFSDQCFLVRVDRVRKDIYRETNPISARYPEYGGELFEKRVDSYMRNHNLKRITSKNISYIHKNFPKKDFRKIIYELFPTIHCHKRYRF